MYEMPWEDRLVELLLVAPIVIALLWFVFRLLKCVYSAASRRKE
jgi:hypothetical protein